MPYKNKEDQYANYLKNRERLNARCRERWKNPSVREKIQSRNKKWRENNRDLILAIGKSHYYENREKLLERQRIYSRVNRDKIRKYQKEYYSRPEIREKERVRGKKYQAENREKINSTARSYYHANRDKLAREGRERWKQRKEAGLIYTFENRYKNSLSSAKRRGVPWDISLEEFSSFEGRLCHYCFGPRGIAGHGLDRMNHDLGYSIGNVLPCCGTCNKIRGTYLTVQEMEIAMKAVLNFRNSQNGDKT